MLAHYVKIIIMRLELLSHFLRMSLPTFAVSQDKEISFELLGQILNYLKLTADLVAFFRTYNIGCYNLYGV